MISAWLCRFKFEHACKQNTVIHKVEFKGGPTRYLYSVDTKLADEISYYCSTIPFIHNCKHGKVTYFRNYLDTETSSSQSGIM